jgi:patatin-like phospholipase/acyl hydrolase
MLILSLDGGGIRGLFTARLLERLELAVPGFLATVDLFAGTSTGGILAAALAYGWMPAKCVGLYHSNAQRIFSASVEHQIESLWELEGPKYSNDGLRAVLTEAFQLTQLHELDTDVLITACDALTRRPVRFTRQNDGALRVVDALLRTSAAEVYFPPVEGRYFDGGNAANNPSLWAVIHAIAGGAAIADLRVLSLGTGNVGRPPMHLGNWGARQWLAHGLLELLMEFPSTLNSHLCAELLAANFLRLDGTVDCALDETDNLDHRLLAPADTLDLSPAIAFLREQL